MDDLVVQSHPRHSNIHFVPEQTLTELPMRRAFSDQQRYMHIRCNEDNEEDSDESSCSAEDSSYARRLRQSDHAKRLYESYIDKDFLSLKLFNPHPLPLEIPHNKLWYSWGADKCRWMEDDGFRRFCETADVDPEAGVQWSPYLLRARGLKSLGCRHSFRSRNKDLGFECSRDLLASKGNEFRFGITGERQKVRRLMQWFRLNAVWDRMSIGERFYI